MSQDHEEWLVDQGVTVLGRRPLYRAYANPRLTGFVDEPNPTQALEISRILESENIFKIEASTGVIKRWKRQSDQIQAAITWANVNTHGHVGSYFTEQYQRHLQLLAENPMYRQAWKEFQEVRILLGETTQWP